MPYIPSHCPFLEIYHSVLLEKLRLLLLSCPVKYTIHHIHILLHSQKFHQKLLISIVHPNNLPVDKFLNVSQILIHMLDLILTLFQFVFNLSTFKDYYCSVQSINGVINMLDLILTLVQTA